VPRRASNRREERAGLNRATSAASGRSRLALLVAHSGPNSPNPAPIGLPVRAARAGPQRPWRDPGPKQLGGRRSEHAGPNHQRRRVEGPAGSEERSSGGTTAGKPPSVHVRKVRAGQSRVKEIRGRASRRCRPSRGRAPGAGDLHRTNADPSRFERGRRNLLGRGAAANRLTGQPRGRVERRRVARGRGAGRGAGARGKGTFTAAGRRLTPAAAATASRAGPTSRSARNAASRSSAPEAGRRSLADRRKRAPTASGTKRNPDSCRSLEQLALPVAAGTHVGSRRRWRRRGRARAAAVGESLSRARGEWDSCGSAMRTEPRRKRGSGRDLGAVRASSHGRRTPPAPRPGPRRGAPAKKVRGQPRLQSP